MINANINLDLCDKEEHIAISSLFSKLEPNNIDYASFTCIKNDKERRYYFSHREWGRISIKRKYVLYDPIVRLAVNVNPFLFNWRHVSYDCDNEIIEKERKKYLNISSAYTLKIASDGSFLSIASSRDDFNIRDYLKNNAARVLAFGMMCHRILYHD